MRRRNATPGFWSAAIAALALLAAGCAASGNGGGHPTTATSGRTHTAQTTAAVTITPANGTRDADPSAGITITATRGTLRKVSVRSRGGAVPGDLSDAGKVWHSRWALGVSQDYTVTATASGSGAAAATSRFRTLTPSSTFRAEIFEGYQQTYGVGMPVILTFSQPITDKAAVERSLQLATARRVVGAWFWDGDQTLDFRPRDYWPAGTTVSFTGHLNGVQGAPGMYGTHTLTQTFRIGPSLVAVGNTRTHRTQIYYNGKLRYNWPISSGKPGDATPDGSYVTVDKGNPVRMKGPGYNLLVPWSVRFTFSGDYYHDAYWSVNAQGFQNVSHGCVNLSPAHAKTYYKLAVPGDPITIVGSPKAGKWDNGWTEWFLSWPQYLRGSALHEAVLAGPNGSTFVSPSSVPATAATAPLQTSPANNWVAR
jgi:lipoprotein-anchoring transpeptidase ErfK/SrfK